jgi:poly(3-hydroxybutyrate) depolymerase
VLYQLHEYNRALLSPVVQMAKAAADMFSAPGSWLAQLPGANRAAAAYELLYRLGKDYEKPPWSIHDVDIDGADVPVVEQVVLAKPFCRLLRFERRDRRAAPRRQAGPRPGGPGRRAAVGSPRHAAARHGAHAARSSRRLRHGLDRRADGAPQRGPFTLDNYVGYLRQFIRRHRRRPNCTYWRSASPPCRCWRPRR